MNGAPDHFISPNYRAPKASPGNFDDWVDIYEDRFWGWYLQQADALKAAGPNAWMVILQLATGFFEPYQIFRTGRDSRNQSRQFFRDGFRSVFRSSQPPLPPSALDALADAIYRDVRCGLFHVGFPRAMVALGSTGQAVTVVLDQKTGKPAQFIIDAHGFLDTVIRAFRSYVAQLRDRTDPDHPALRAAFESAWHLVHKS